jgi:hypothetical protein
MLYHALVKIVEWLACPLLLVIFLNSMGSWFRGWF